MDRVEIYDLAEQGKRFRIKFEDETIEEGMIVGGFIQLRIQLTKTHAYDTSKYDFGGISHENAEILF